MRQAELSVTDGKTPVVILHQNRHCYEDAVCMIRLDDLAVLMREMERRVA